MSPANKNACQICLLASIPLLRFSRAYSKIKGRDMTICGTANVADAHEFVSCTAPSNVETSRN